MVWKLSSKIGYMTPEEISNKIKKSSPNEYNSAKAHDFKRVILYIDKILKKKSLLNKRTRDNVALHFIESY